MEPLNLSLILFFNFNRTNIGKRHGICPVVSAENHIQGTPFHEERSDSQIPFLFIGNIIGVRLLQLFPRNILIHLAAYCLHCFGKLMLFPICQKFQQRNRKEVGHGLGIEKCPQINGQTDPDRPVPGPRFFIFLINGPDQGGGKKFCDAYAVRLSDLF